MNGMFLARVLPATCFLFLFSVSARGQSDCVPYEPTDAGQTVNGIWDAAFEIDTYSFTVPSDPGGGYVTVRVGTDSPSRPHMRIIPPSGQGVVAQSAPSFPGPSPQSLEVAFEVAPGTSFELEIFEDAVSSVFPVNYTWGWTFVSRVDCFERNNASPADWPAPISVAKRILLDQELEAYSLAGHQTYAISAVEPQNFDWFTFTLSEAQTIEASTLSVPADQQIRIRLFDSEGLVVADTVPELGDTGTIGPITLPAGSYYLDLHPEIRGEASVTLSESGSIPEHFNTPYRFVVRTLGLSAAE
jgi:hypothetical protein